MSSEFTAAVRALLLPIHRQFEVEYLAFVSERLVALDVPEPDHATWLNVELRNWRQSGNPSGDIQSLIQLALYDPNRNPRSFVFDDADGDWDDIAKRAGGTYFDLHRSLQSSHLLDHDAARQLLSHTGIIARLAVLEGMTASEISRLIAAKDARFERNWRVIQTMLQRLGIAPAIEQADFQATFQADVDAEANLFGDLDFQGSIELVAGIAAGLGCPGDFERWLTDLMVTDRHDPYLLILHFQLIVQAHYDHASTYPYEFNPRGQNAIWLTDQYVDAGIPVAQSAFLNNAKATLRFDSSWVAGRTDHSRGAKALASILMQMESLGALAKVEMAAHLRALLARHIRLEREQNGPLVHALPPLGQPEVHLLVQRVGVQNSGTTGIIEQRIVDCLGVLRHSSQNGWATRGVGDSVFAPNLPRRKMGDVEFMLPSPEEPQIRAYEAHGGQLSPPYVADHMNTLMRVLAARVEELEAIASLADWSVCVCFVAHAFHGELPPTCEFNVSGCDVVVELEYVSFAEIVDEISQSPEAATVMTTRLVTPLNSPFVHYRVRQRYLELLEP